MNFKALLKSRSPEAMTGRNQPTLLSRPRIGRHFLELVMQRKEKHNPQKGCVFCTKEQKRNKSQYQCKNCETHLRFAQTHALNN